MFYHFSQNNSGGRFDFTDTLTRHVVVEADNAEDANGFLESLGGYFDGCDSGRDCECCGDRWAAQWSYDGSDVPELFGTPVEELTKKDLAMIWSDEGFPEVRVHYIDGTVKEYLLEGN